MPILQADLDATDAMFLMQLLDKNTDALWIKIHNDLWSSPDLADEEMVEAQAGISNNGRIKRTLYQVILADEAEHNKFGFDDREAA